MAIGPPSRATWIAVCALICVLIGLFAWFRQGHTGPQVEEGGLIAREAGEVGRKPEPGPSAREVQDAEESGAVEPGDAAEPEAIASEPSPQEHGALSGRVIKNDGGPLAECRITFVSENASDALEVQRHSGEDGHFRFDTLPAGAGTIRAVHDNAVTAELEVRVPAGGERRGVVIQLAPAATIFGRVSHGSEAPVPDARVRVIGPDASVLGETRSDADNGRYQLKKVTPEATEVEATHPRWGNVSALIEPVPYEAIRVPLVFGEWGRVDIRLENWDEDAFDVRVYLEPVDNEFVFREKFESRDAVHMGSGQFRADNLPEGVHRVVVEQLIPEGGWQLEDAVEVTPGALMEAVLRVPAGTASLSGTVRIRGTVAERASASMRVVDGSAQFRVQAEEMSGGRFRFDSLPTGTGIIFVDAQVGDEARHRYEQVDLVANESRVMNVDFTEKGRLVVDVTGDVAETIYTEELESGMVSVLLVAPAFLGVPETNALDLLRYAEQLAQTAELHGAGVIDDELEPGDYRIVHLRLPIENSRMNFDSERTSLFWSEAVVAAGETTYLEMEIPSAEDKGE